MAAVAWGDYLSCTNTITVLVPCSTSTVTTTVTVQGLVKRQVPTTRSLSPTRGTFSAASGSSFTSSPRSSTFTLSPTTSCSVVFVTATATASTVTTTVTTTYTKPPLPTPTGPCQGANCGNYTTYPCGGPLGNCACGIDAGGQSFCFQNNDCGLEEPCTLNIDCPDSTYRCLVGSCCDGRKCVKVEPASTCQNRIAGRFIFAAGRRDGESNAKRGAAVCSNSDGSGCQKKA